MALIHLDHHSEALGMAMSATVVLPQQTTSQIGMAGRRGDRIPVLWLLHGLSDDHTIWERRTSVERYAAKYGIAVVMPNGHRSWYTDMHSGGKYFSYISEELPALCRSFFRGFSEEREDNYVAGLSMGGYGTLKLAMTHPERYAGAASFSGALDVADHRFKTAFPALWESVFGPIDRIAGSENDLFALVKKPEFIKNPPRLYLSCGTEDALLETNRKMKAELDRLGVPVRYREAPGNHTWEFWDAEIQLALAFFFEEKGQ
ncbi:MAG: esterase family protein [Clostridia bacterium]|nr:esterase family protein [Clostridia bacterium]